MFNETRLLDCVAYGSQFGQEFNTNDVRLRSGRSRRNARWSRPLGQYSVLYRALKPEHHAVVRNAHMASMGSLIGFRFKDWTDYRAEAEPIGTGTGDPQELQLMKNYDFGPINFERPVAKPVSGTVTVYESGVPVAATVDYETGIVTVTAPGGSPITWAGEFDVPVHFTDDRLDVEPNARHGVGFLLTADVGLEEIRL